MILGLLKVSTINHGDAVLWMNANQNDFLSVFFKIWTYLGDWITFGVIAIALLVFYRKAGYIFLLIGAIQGIISWAMKNVFFKGAPRPKKYFEEQDILNFIEGVEVREFNSFPSGHTMTAFAMATFLALILKRKEWSPFILIVAVLVGLSRIYLHQHFLIDVVAGSFIGFSVSFLIYLIFDKYLEQEKNLISR